MKLNNLKLVSNRHKPVYLLSRTIFVNIDAFGEYSCKTMELSDENINVLEPEIDSNKKSFLIRDILQQSTESVPNPVFDATEFVPNERLISWILQNRSQFSEFSQFPILSSSLLDTMPEVDSEVDSFGTIFHEMNKRKLSLSSSHLVAHSFVLFVLFLT